MFRPFKYRNVLVGIVVLIFLLVGIDALTNNRLVRYIGLAIQGDETVHVSDINNILDDKEIFSNDVDVDEGGQDDLVNHAEMNSAIECLDQAYSIFYNPFIQSHQAYEELILPLWDESISDEDRLDRLAKAKFAAQALQSQLVQVSPPTCLSSITDAALRNMGAEILTNLDFVRFEDNLKDWYMKALNYLQSSSDCFDSMISYEGTDTVDDYVESVCAPMMTDLDKYYDAVAEVDKFSERVRLEMEE